MARFASAIILVIGLFSSTSGAQSSASLGPLPQGANGHLRFSAIRAEVGFTVFVDSALVQHLVPRRIKLIRLRDAARRDTALAGYLAAHPTRGSDAITQFVFSWPDSLVIEELHHRVTMPQSVFWWAAAVQNHSLDQRAKGSQTAVELASWTSDTTLANWIRARAGTKNIGRIGMTHTDATWILSLRDSSATISATCRLSGVRQAMDFPSPAFATVWHSGPHADAFVVYTYAGNHFQACEAPTLTANGQSIIARAINSRSAWLDAGVEDGWVARAGFYSRKR
jgi:hypothetical protein